ncbi:MAG: NADH-quinone oxidoreductase subunit N [Thermoflexibacteraceae bacterium]
MPSNSPFQFLAYCYPETVWVLALLCCLLVELADGAKKWQLVVLFLAVASNIALLAQQYYAMPKHPTMDLVNFYPQYIAFDYLAVLLLGLTAGQLRLYPHLHNGVVYATLCLLTFALQLLNNTTHLLLLFLLLEIVAMGSYVLIALHKQAKAAEASLKYLLFGATVAGILLYSISLYYGITQSLVLQPFQEEKTAFWAAITLIGLLAGAFFKLVAVPLHSWSPDVYEGSPSPITFFLTTASKLAGIIFLQILLHQLFPQPLESALLLMLLLIVQIVMVVITFASLLVGTLGALPQNNLKRLLAYSSIAHTGFLLLAFLANAQHLVVYYLLAYTLASAMIFYVLSLKESKGQSTSIQSFAGEGVQNKLIGVALTLSFMSLAGLPPTAGFTAKLFVFTTFFSRLSSDIFLGKILLGFALLSTVVSLFFYLKVPYQLFFKKTPTQMPTTLQWADYCYLLICLLALLLVFVGASWFVG